jgi:hypothetical protein
MQIRIDAREAELIAELKPTTTLQRTLIKEMARGEIQKDVAHALLIDSERLWQDVNTTWDEDQKRRADNLAARLPRDPMRVANTLLATKQGAEWVLEQWRGLAASVTENGGLKEPQRQLALDLKGVSPLLRDNTRIVPAAGDKEGLLALFAREIKRLEDRLVLVLQSRDTVARGKTRLGLLPAVDAATRKYKSDEARAHKRYVWAFESFKWVRMGMPASAIIDPATGKPLQDPEAEAAGGAPKPPPSATGATSSATPSASPDAASGSSPKQSEGEPNNKFSPDLGRYSPEDQQAIMVVSGFLSNLTRGARRNVNGSGPPPTAPPKNQ